MRHMIDPRQSCLFDVAESMFSPMALERLRNDWPQVFRTALLHLMPVGQLAEHFHPFLGNNTKELYSMAGAIFLKEFFNLTIAQAVDACMFDARWMYALNVQPITASMSHASIERYSALLLHDELAVNIFHDVTGALIAALELDVSRQRLDSTHIESDMAVFGRTRLMAVTIKRFLVQLKRHEEQLYSQLPADLLERYAPAESQMFGRYNGDRHKMRQTMAEDLLALVGRFAGNATVTSRSSYKAIARVLAEQCDVLEETVAVKNKIEGGEGLQNPSDPDATYSGHKGVGYSVQISQTCTEGNDAQLITAVQVDPAHQADQHAVEPMLEQLDASGLAPELMYADQGYGGDEGVQLAQGHGVDLQSPVAGRDMADGEKLTLDDFVIDEKTETVECCPNGCTPQSSRVDQATGRTRTVMRSEDCYACTFRAKCAIRQAGKEFVLIHKPIQRRSAERRAEQATDAFMKNYSIRSGMESTNSALKRATGLGRLRTRGLARMRMGVLLRCAGWNMKRATAALKARARKVGIDLITALKSATNRLSNTCHAHKVSQEPFARPNQYLQSLQSLQSLDEFLWHTLTRQKAAA